MSQTVWHEALAYDFLLNVEFEVTKCMFFLINFVIFTLNIFEVIVVYEYRLVL